MFLRLGGHRWQAAGKVSPQRHRQVMIAFRPPEASGGASSGTKRFLFSRQKRRVEERQ